MSLFLSELISEKCEPFASTKCRLRKGIIVNDIVRTLEKFWGAKFYDGPHYNGSTSSSEWKEVEREKVIIKVRQALNDKKKKSPEKERRHSRTMSGIISMSSSMRSLMQTSLKSLDHSMKSLCNNSRRQLFKKQSRQESFLPGAMMFENDVYFSIKQSGDEEDHDDVDLNSSLGNKRYQELRSTYISKESFNSASSSQRKMIAREIVSKMERDLGTSFISNEGKILDEESAVEKVYQDLYGAAANWHVESLDTMQFNNDDMIARHHLPPLPMNHDFQRDHQQKHQNHDQYQHQHYHHYSPTSTINMMSSNDFVTTTAPLEVVESSMNQPFQEGAQETTTFAYQYHSHYRHEQKQLQQEAFCNTFHNNHVSPSQYHDVQAPVPNAAYQQVSCTTTSLQSYNHSPSPANVVSAPSSFEDVTEDEMNYLTE